MSRTKEQKRMARKLLKKPPGKLLPVDLSRAPYTPGMTCAFRNNRYTVMVYEDSKMTKGVSATRVMIQRHDDKPFSNHWKEIQGIKNEIFGPEVTAIEYFPAESELIDDHNIYWIWILPEGILPMHKGSE